MNTTMLDGVTVLTRDCAGPLRAALVFAAGVGHGSYRTLEVPHLVELCIMGSLPSVGHATEGRTNPDRMVFETTGTPEEVRKFLEAVCAAIQDLPLSRMPQAARAIGNQGRHVTHPMVAGSAFHRYGLRGPGLVGGFGVPPSQNTEEQARRFAEAHLVAGNAVLILTGPIPEGLRLDLRPGARVGIPTVRRPDSLFPSILRSDAPQPFLSIEAVDSLAALRLHRIWFERVAGRLASDLGIDAEVELLSAPAGTGHRLLAVTVDGPYEHEETIGRTLLDSLRDLAEIGPADQEMADDLEECSSYMSDEDSTMDLLEHAANRILDGFPPQSPEGIRAELASMSREQVRDVARASLGTAQLLVSESAWGRGSTPQGLTDVTDVEWEDVPEIAGREFPKKLLRLAPLNTRLRASDEGISIRFGPETRSTRWEDVVGVDTADGSRELMRWDTLSITFRVSAFKNGDELAAIIDARLPELLYDSEEGQ